MDAHVKAPTSVAAESEGQSHSQAQSQCPSAEPPSTARLIARRTPPKTGRRHVYLYDVEFDGELVITGSAEPACDFARAMRVRGHRGWIKVIDADSGMHRYSVNIEKAARLTVRDTEREGPRFVKWKPLNPGDGSPRTGGRGQS